MEIEYSPLELFKCVRMNKESNTHKKTQPRGLNGLLKAIPCKFTLNTGHVMFFMDKGKYLQNRFLQLQSELIARGYQIPQEVVFDAEGIFDKHQVLNNDYVPDEQAYAIIRERIAQKIAMKPDWYRYSGYTK